MVPVLLAALALHGSTQPFVAHVGPVAASGLRWSWRAGCPVAPSQLRLVRVGYFGFDGRTHTGTLVVNARVTGAVVSVFRRLYAERFPIRRMEPIDAFHGNDEASMAADNTSAFNCRYAVASGPRRWSVHAYGEAIDVNPVENPYLLAGGRAPVGGQEPPRPLAARAGSGRFGRRARRGVSRGRLAVGRALERLARLPALLRHRRLRNDGRGRAERVDDPRPDAE